MQGVPVSSALRIEIPGGRGAAGQALALMLGLFSSCGCARLAGGIANKPISFGIGAAP
jgi:hypothetical protein